MEPSGLDKPYMNLTLEFILHIEKQIRFKVDSTNLACGGCNRLFSKSNNDLFLLNHIRKGEWVSERTNERSDGHLGIIWFVKLGLLVNKISVVQY